MAIKFNGVKVVSCSSPGGGGGGNATVNLLADAKWKMSPASDPGDVSPASGYFKYFEVNSSLQLAVNTVNTNAKSVTEYLTSTRALSETEELVVTIVQTDDKTVYRSGLVTAMSAIYSTGPGSAAIIATTLLDSNGTLTTDKEYSVVVNVKGEQGFQGVQGDQGVQGAQGFQGFQGVQGYIGVPSAPQGVQGAQGFQGDRGDRGDTGPQGVQGAQGPQGLFGGPQGFQGVQGPQGVQGDPQGPQGVQGPPGPEGAWGPQGPQGYPGDRGPQGYQGVAGGPQGYQGVQGATGPQGYQGIAGGPQGDRGYQGFQGTQGFQGSQGPAGDQGLQGYQGFQGAPGFVGTQGETGVQGSQGLQGTQGPQGFQGQSIQGAQGTQGTQGVQGAQGVQGSQGAQGVQGDPTGPQGPQGAQGISGNAGVTSTYIEGPAVDSTVSLLLHMDGTNNSITFIDRSASPKTVTAYGDAKISTAASKFGGSSAAFDGTGDYLMWPKTAIGSSDFTIEGWVNLNSLASYQSVFGGTEIGLDIQNSTTIVMGYNSTPGGFARTVPTISTGTWYHFAISRTSGTIRIFWNGTQAGATVSSATMNNSSTNWVIGRNSESLAQYYLNGYVDEFRITIGTGRYTANFTPPTSAFADADGSLNSALLPSNPAVGDIVYSSKGFYVCSSRSPVTWREYYITPTTIAV